MEEEYWKRAVERERKARKEAERYMEEKSAELFHANQQLKTLNEELLKRTDRSEKRYEQLLESVNDVIYILNAEGKFNYMNEPGLEMLGKTLSEVQEMYFADLLKPTSKAEIESFYLALVERKETKSYLEIQIQVKSQEERWIGQNANLVFDGDQLVEVYVVARDITLFRSMRAQLEQSERKYRGMIENLHLGLMEVDVKGRVISINDSFAAMTGFKLKEIVGKDAKDLFLFQDEVKEMQKQEALRSQGRGELYELKIKHKDGSPRWVMIAGTPIYNPGGEIIGSIGIHLDITERKEIENDLVSARKDAELARQAEKDFLARMSHEIRTPLNAVMGMSHLMIYTPLNEEQQSYMTSIHYSAQLLKGLVNDVLDYSKIEAGQMDVIKSSFDLFELTDSIKEMFRYTLAERDLDFILEYHNSAPKHVHMDKLILNQILLNLISNAVKFTESGWVNLTVTGNDEKVTFKVQDTGIGLDIAESETLFESFKRSEDSESREREGTGLGLSIVKRLVELHDGTIEVAGEKGVGTVFTVTLPYETTVADEELSSRIEKKEGKKLSILIAEDNEMNLQYLTNLLDKFKHDLSIARNGQEALELSESKRFDLILMDIQMPKMDGLEVTARIRTTKSNPNLKTHIVGLSAFAFKTDVEASIKAGMNNYITKPYLPADIYRILGEKVTLEKGNSPKEVKELDQDQAYLDELYGGDQEHLTEMYSIFNRTCPAIVQEIRQAIDNDSAEVVQASLHKLSPMVKMVGFVKVANELKSYEQLVSEDSEFQRIKENIKKALLEVDEIRAYLEK